VIYTEFNSWWGPVAKSGVMAMRGLFQYGLDLGMAGGTMYKLTDVAKTHPGIFSQDAWLIERREFAEAVKQYFADAELDVLQRSGRRVRIAVRNRRDYTLRSVTAVFVARGRELSASTFERIGPREQAIVDITLPEAWQDESVLVSATIRFVTHHAFPCTVQTSVPIGTP